MRIFREIHILFWLFLGYIILNYLLIQNAGHMTPNIDTLAKLAVAVDIIFAWLNRVNVLLTIKEAQDIAFKNSKLMQNRGELRQDGKLLIHEDGVLRHVNDRPDNIIVACVVDCHEPQFIVYNVHPYTGYIKRQHKCDYWDAKKDPDLKIIMPPAMIDAYMARRQFSTDADLNV